MTEHYAQAVERRFAGHCQVFAAASIVGAVDHGLHGGENPIVHVSHWPLSSWKPQYRRGTCWNSSEPVTPSARRLTTVHGAQKASTSKSRRSSSLSHTCPWRLSASWRLPGSTLISCRRILCACSSSVRSCGVILCPNKCDCESSSATRTTGTWRPEQDVADLLAVKDAVGQLAHLGRDLLRQRYDLALTVDAKDVAAQLLGHAARAVHLLLHHVGRVLEIHLQIRLFDGIQELRLVAGRGALVAPDAGEDLDRGAHRLISLSYLCVDKGVEDLPGLGVGHRLAGLGAGVHRATTAAVRKVHLQAIGNRYDLGLINFV